jgi:hypothetical protein
MIFEKSFFADKPNGNYPKNVVSHFGISRKTMHSAKSGAKISDYGLNLIFRDVNKFKWPLTARKLN